MKSKKRLLKDSHLYVILDKKLLGNKPIINTARKIKDLGVDIIQFRDKESNKEITLKYAYKLRKLLLNSKTVFIINDYIDIAKMVDSDGIHLGQDDLPIEIARQILGKDKIIGVSCHNLEQAIRAQNRGADYIGIGPVFSTPIKPTAKTIGLGSLKEIKKKIKIPFFAIGGINENNIDRVLSYGAKRVVVCRVICQAKNLARATKNIKDQLNK